MRPEDAAREARCTATDTPTTDEEDCVPKWKYDSED